MQRTPTCPRCHHAYGGKDPTKPHGPRMPLLLECGHTFCEGCLMALAKQKESLDCPKCQISTSFKSGETSVKTLWPDIYVMGILALNRKLSLNQDHLKLNPVGMIHLPKKKSRHQDQHDNAPLCSECATTDATCFCQKCDAVMCGNCFDKVHQASKTLRKHQAVPVTRNGKSSEPVTCSEHSDRLLEYFCDEDQTLICSHCFIVGSHQGHSITALEEKNSECKTNVQSRLEDVNRVYALLKKSDKTLMRIAPELKLDTMQLIEDIKCHFQDLHAILQAREMKLLKEVEELIHKQTLPLEEIRYQLQEGLVNVERTISEAKKVIANNQDEVLNPHAVLKKMKEAVDICCYFQYNMDHSSKLSWDFKEEVQQTLKEYGEITVKSALNIKVLPLLEVPEAELQDVNNCVTPESISTQTSELIDTESETRSVASEASTSSTISIGPKKLPRSRVTSYKQELVYVTHIKNPSHFMVQRVADYDRVTTLNKGIKKFCNGPEGEKATLTSVDIDDLVLCFFTLDQSWYRARVLSVNDSMTPIQVEVFYLDYGNSETVTIDRLLSIHKRFLKIPELSTACSLWDIMPSDEGGEWKSTATDAFALMTNDKPLVMTLVGNRESLALVDLSKPVCEDIQDDRPVSVRDALVFLEFATFVSPVSSPMALTGNCRSGVPMLYSRRFLPPEMPKENEKVPVVISHIESPEQFSVQIAGEDANYLNHMMNRIQDTYVRDKNGTYAVYVPQIGMICVAQFSDGAWYRAEVVELPGKQMVGVKYVDFGNKDGVHYTKLKKIKDEFTKLPTQALDCQLADLKPIEAGEWSEQVLQVLSNYYQSTVELHIEKIINGNKIQGVLCDITEPQNPICINSLLVENNLAECTGPSSKPQSKHVLKTEPFRCITPPEVIKEVPDVETTKSAPSPPADAPPHAKVVVSHVVNPSHLYIQLHTAASDGLLEIMEDLQNMNTNSIAKSNVTWHRGDFCAVCYTRDGRWYRAKIEEMSDAVEQVQVHLIDYGYKEIQEKAGLRPLTDSISEKPCYSVLCHLDNIQPAGDITKWSQTAIEALREKVDDQNLYIVYKKKINGGKSIPIDLLIDDHVIGDALSAHQLQYISLTEWLKDKGLALPKHKVSPAVTETECQEESSVTKPLPPPTVEGDIAIVSTADTFPPPKPPIEREMKMIPTYVDYDCIIYGQPLYPETSPQGRFGYILKENTIEILLQDQYLEGKGLYRAMIPRDGNCLFRCFSQGIWGDQSRYDEMRQEVIKGIQENWWLFQNIIGDKDKESYLQEMSRESVYGGEPEIQAVCHLFQISARIYLGGLNYGIQEREYGNSMAPRTNLCYVSDGKYDNGHYDLIVEDMGSVAVIEKSYEEWRTHKLIELLQNPSYYNTVNYEESLLHQVMEFIQKEYLATLPETGYVDWKLGQAVVARYPNDNLFYRCIIRKINSENVKVQFIDFGDSKDIEKADLRKRLVLESVPQQCYRLVINNIQPVQGTSWGTQTLDYIHSLVVNETCSIKIVDRPYLPGDLLLVNITLPTGEDLAEHLLSCGFAKRLDQMDTQPMCYERNQTDYAQSTKEQTANFQLENERRKVVSPCLETAPSISSNSSNTPVNISPARPGLSSNRESPQRVIVASTETNDYSESIKDPKEETLCDFHVVYKEENDIQVQEVSSTNPDHEIPMGPLRRTVKSPYKLVKLGEWKDLIPVQVTQVDSPSEVYVQFLNQTKPKTPEQLEISKLLAQLLEVQKIINTEMEHYPNVTDAKPGMACCAQFSMDQTWYRAEILDVTDGFVGVLFVDYGNSEYIPNDRLRQIPDDLVDMPTMAVRCCLEGVNPPAIGSWSTEDNWLMQQCLAGLDLIAVIKEVEDLEPLVSLYDIEEYKLKDDGASLVYEPFLTRQLERQFSDSSVIVEEEELIGDDDDDEILPRKSHKSWADQVEESD